MIANFSGFFGGINDESLFSYQNFLLGKMDLAVEVALRNVNTNSFTATPNHCHDNSDDYCIINPKCKKIEGWLTITYPKSPFTTIASHSIIMLENGELIDITPMAIQQKCRFLSSFLNTNIYKNLVNYLYETKGQTTMFVINP